MRRFWWLLLVAGIAGTTACRADEASGAALVRKCEAYLYGAKRGSADQAAVGDAAYCAAFIRTTIAAARLAHERHGMLPPNSVPPGSADDKAYRMFALSINLGVDICLPEGLTTQEVARKLRLAASLDHELLWADELATLEFALWQSYSCKSPMR